MGFHRRQPSNTQQSKNAIGDHWTLLNPAGDAIGNLAGEYHIFEHTDVSFRLKPAYSTVLLGQESKADFSLHPTDGPRIRDFEVIKQMAVRTWVSALLISSGTRRIRHGRLTSGPDQGRRMARAKSRYPETIVFDLVDHQRRSFGILEPPHISAPSPSGGQFPPYVCLGLLGRPLGICRFGSRRRRPSAGRSPCC